MKQLRDKLNIEFLEPGIIQFGEGNFLRGFADFIVNELNVKELYQKGVIIIQPRRPNKCTELNNQEGLYHIIIRGFENGREVSDVQLIKSVNECINCYDNFEGFKAVSELPRVNIIISNTTEAGIEFLDEPFDPRYAAQTFPGKLTQLLYWRYLSFEGDSRMGFHVLPCELIENNGDNLLSVVYRYIDHWNLGKEFEKWVGAANVFHNTLVDRIIPGAPEAMDEIEGSLTFKDKKAVVSEPYLLWAIEKDEGLLNILPLNKIDRNIFIRESIDIYRELKVKILNGAHTCMTIVGSLLGSKSVLDIMSDPVINTYIGNLLFREIGLTVKADQEEISRYISDTLERFKNPFIVHKLYDISLNNIAKFKVRVLPSLLQYFKIERKVPKYLAFAFSSLLVFYRGKGLSKSVLLNDDQNSILKIKEAWENDNLNSLLANSDFWGTDIIIPPEISEYIIAQAQELSDFNTGQFSVAVEHLNSGNG